MLSYEQMLLLNSAAGASDYSNRIVHYTSENNLGEILKSEELWFGRIDQMNDDLEYDHLLLAIRRVAHEIVPELPAQMVDQAISTYDALIRNAAYVSSWCEYDEENSPEGSLQMWRAYGDNAGGVAAVVDSSNLQPSSLTPQKLEFFVNSSRVQYVRKEEVAATVAQILDRVRQTKVLERIPNAGIALAAMLVAKAPTTKHHSFREEQEVRFLVMPRFSEVAQRFIPTDRIRKIRTNENVKEYFSLPLKNWTDFNFDLRLSSILRKILIGPLNDPMARKERIEQQLIQAGLLGVAVEIVDIPLRA